MTYESRSLRNLTLRQLRVFSEVARQESFTGAARKLHLTQPAVSMQVKELETSCGMPLFERVGRGIRLTEAGAELARCAGAVAETLRETEERIDAMRGLKRGLLKLGAVSTAKYFAPSLLAAFQASYPDVQVRFSVSNREEMIRQLANHESDLIIMGRPPQELRTTAEPFTRHPLVVIAHPEHPLAGRRRVSLERLARENFLIREQGSGTRAAMEQLFADAGLRYRASMSASSNETLKQAVMAGMGLSFLSAHTAGLELSTGRLAVLDVEGLPLVKEWFIIHLENKRLAPIAAAFRAFLLERGSGLIDEAIGHAGALRGDLAVAAV